MSNEQEIFQGNWNCGKPEGEFIFKNNQGVFKIVDSNAIKNFENQM